MSIKTMGKKALRKAKNFTKKNTVTVIAFFAALVTCFIVPPDKKYLSYIDFKTLACLFSVLAVVRALRNLRFFYKIASSIVKVFKNTRNCILALVYITFIGSMLIANDMALLTFLPLGYYVLRSTGKEKYMAFTFIMQNIAANLGGMLTPFGNPQNLYLYTKFNIPTGEFVMIMLKPFIIAVILITLCCLFVKREELLIEDEKIILPPGKTTVYIMLFILAIMMVFRFMPYQLGFVIVAVSIFYLDKYALQKVDYPLLMTFVFFFIFAGNMGRIEAVKEVFSYLLEKNTLIFSVLSCQVISNVPSAILLSQFTDNYRHLLWGVNIGGAGTLIASLASLITLREYTKRNKGKRETVNYILQFSAFNFAFVIILTGAMLLIG
ncbi:MAG: SLC13 family permease [Clostridia bacterium]